MLQQLDTFRALGLGNCRDLLIAVAQDPAMLVFADAGVNAQGCPMKILLGGNYGAVHHGSGASTRRGRT